LRKGAETFFQEVYIFFSYLVDGRRIIVL